ncbi:MAG: DUF3307 domain-containing protein [Elusimicrobiales bacterium]
MIIFWRLMLAHMLGDFTLQFDAVAEAKRKTWWGMFIHTGTHFVLALALSWNYLGQDWVSFGGVKLGGWAALGCMFLIHHLQDEWRIFAIRNYKTADGTIHFLWDQFVHTAAIFVFSPVIGFYTDGSIFPEKWVILGILAVFVTHFATVLVYFVEKDFYNSQFPGFDEKYFTMLQRFVLCMFFLIPGWQWLPYFGLWGGYMVYLWRQRFIDFGKAGVYVGTALALAAGIMARRVFHV